ncbi:MAG: hypothetical protein EAZ61_08080 [Oscillatoriales cyanobacterium]|nr:MAG: hypothetical protein EAZ61_08080 [Oscillatoriales cyanobacterium]
MGKTSVFILNRGVTQNHDRLAIGKLSSKPRAAFVGQVWVSRSKAAGVTSFGLHVSVHEFGL